MASQMNRIEIVKLLLGAEGIEMNHTYYISIERDCIYIDNLITNYFILKNYVLYKLLPSMVQTTTNFLRTTSQTTNHLNHWNYWNYWNYWNATNEQDDNHYQQYGQCRWLTSSDNPI